MVFRESSIIRSLTLACFNKRPFLEGSCEPGRHKFACLYNLSKTKSVFVLINEQGFSEAG